MSLNIKNPRVHTLARAAAARTGRSQTSVIEVALHEFLQRLDEQEAEIDGDRLKQILADLDGRLDADARALLDHDDLYDETGLPS